MPKENKKSVMCSCIYCRKEYSSKGIFTHVDRSHLQKTHYSSGNNGKYDELSEKAARLKSEKQSAYMLSPKKCSECGSTIEFDQRKNKFCSHSCSAIYTNRKRTEHKWNLSEHSRLKISNKLKKIRYDCTCSICGTNFKSQNPEKDYCTKSCKSQHRKAQRRAQRSLLANYRIDCAFKFNIKDYPQEFNFELIEQHGWYKPANRGNNLTGVSRDHMISVRYGFDNNIDPKIIAHPANCQLLLHGENVSKYTNCSISFEELLEKIKIWDEKYNKEK